VPQKPVEKQQQKQQPQENSQTNKPIVYKKGQKTKQKKIQQKYAWQDEEDRKLNMALLGHGEKDKTSRKEKIKDEKDKIKEKKENTKVRQKQKLAHEKEQEEIRQLLKDEKVDLLSEEDKKKLKI